MTARLTIPQGTAPCVAELGVAGATERLYFLPAQYMLAIIRHQSETT